MEESPTDEPLLPRLEPHLSVPATATSPQLMGPQQSLSVDGPCPSLGYGSQTLCGPPCLPHLHCPLST